MVRMSVRYMGRLRCEAGHEPSGSRIETDAPADNHGRAGRFSPTDLVAAALATCMSTIMGILAERKGWDLTGMGAEVEKVMTEKPPRTIARIGIRIHMPRGLPSEARLPLEQAALACPVARSLHPDVQVETRFIWPD